MSEPLRETRRNKATGEVRDFVSDDGGKSWRMDDTSAADDALDRRIKTAGPEDTTAIAPPEPGDGQVPRAAPAPEGEPTPQAPAPPPPAPGAPGVGASLARGAGQGASLGFGDEAGGFGAWLASKVHGGDIPRAAGRGLSAPLSGATDYEVARNAERGANAAARAAHPLAYGAGQVAGGMAPAIALAPVAPMPASALGRVGVGMAQGAAMGGAAAAGQNENPATLGSEVEKGAVMGGAVGGAIPAVAEGAGALGVIPRKVADYARGMAAGGRALPKGADVSAYGRTVNELGLPGVMPKSAHGYEKAARAAADETGAELGAGRAAASAEGRGAPVEDVTAKLNALRDKYLRENTASGDRQARAVEDELGRLQGSSGAPLAPGQAGPEAQVSVKQLAERAKALRGPTEGGYPQRGAARTTGTDTSEARKLAKRAMAGEYSGLENTAAPELQAAKSRFSDLADVQKNAGARARAERGPHFMTDLAAGAAGAHFGNPITAAKAMVTAELANRFGPDVAAKLGYATAAPLEAAGRAAGGAARAGGAIAPALMSPAGSSTATPATPAPQQGTGATVANNTGGKRSSRSSTVDQALDDPRYGPLLRSKPEEQRDVIYVSLAATDPEFRERMRKRAEQAQGEQ